MAKLDWGTKRLCQSCATKFYDFGRTPIVCPKCETVFDPETLLKSRRRQPPAPKPVKAVKAPAPAKAIIADGDDDIDLDADLDDTDDDADDDSVLEDTSDLEGDDVSDVVSAGEDDNDDDR